MGIDDPDPGQHPGRSAAADAVTDTTQPHARREGTVRRWTGVRTLATLRSAIALVFLLGWVLFPGDRTLVLTSFGTAMIGLSLVEIAATGRLRPVGRPGALLRGLGPAAGGLVILLGSPEDLTRLAPAAGMLLLVRAVGDAVAAATIGRRIRMLSWLVGLSVAEAITGIGAVWLTELFGQVAVVTLGFTWLGGGVLAGVSPRRPHIREVTLAPMPRRGPLPPEERRRIADEVFFEGPDTRERLVRFVVLLAIATIIATYGVLGDSAAAVIGGMIVAPLMLPIQALTAGLVSGATRKALTATVVLVGGIGLVLLLSMFIASTFRDLDTSLLNAQVTSRTSPALTDLAIALAAGAAGGFALIRRDVADSLPGVAIAVSLVPPLCVSGASLAGAHPREAVGAFLLFAVNFVAIVLASGAVLLIGGFGRIEGRHSNRLLTLSAAFGVALVGLALPLGLTGLDTLRQENLDSAVRTELTVWLEPVQPADVLNLTIDGDHVTVLIASVDPPPPTSTLTRAVSDEVGRPVIVEVHWVTASRVR